MPIHAVCPECRAAYDLVDEQRGKKVRCKQCEYVFVVGAASKPNREEGVREAETVRERSGRAAPIKAVPAAPRRTSARDDDYDREGRRRPAPRKKGGALGPILLIGGLSVLALVVILGGGGLIFMLWRFTKDSDNVSNPRIVSSGGKPLEFDDPRDNNPPVDKGPVDKPVVDNAPVREPVVKDAPPDENAKPVAGAPGQLPPAVLRKVKRATAFIRVTMPEGGQASGSGFFAIENNVLLTNAHVLGMLNPQSRPPKNIEVILDSGDKTEQRFGARIRGVDRDSDLAALQVVLRDDQKEGTIPKPLEVKPAGDLSETQQLFVVGFPFGEQLGKEITISPTSVSSLRKDRYGFLEKVQVNGGMHPGNSGGPVVDGNGDVVGVAVSVIRGTTINFAIPGERLRSLVQGRMKEIVPGSPYHLDAKVVMPVTIHMIDPLNRIKEVALDVWTGDGKNPRPPVVGETPKELPGDSPHLQAKLTYQQGTAKGDVVLPSLPPGKVYYTQPLWINAAGAKQWGPGDAREVRPVDRKPARLVLQQQKGERTLTLETEEDAKEHQLLKIKVSGQIREKTSDVDKKTGAKLSLQFTTVQLGITADDRPIQEEETKKLAGYLGKITRTVVQDPQGNLEQFQADMRVVPQDSQQPIWSLNTQIQHALEVAAVPLPNKEVQCNDQWKATRTVLLTAGDRPDPGLIAMTYTYLGTRKSAGGREEAVIGLEGTIAGIDPRAQDRVAGKATGTAVVDLATGQITLAETTISLDSNTLKVKLQRSVP